MIRLSSLTQYPGHGVKSRDGRRENGIRPEQLAQIWDIGLEAAERTVRENTQRGDLDNATSFTMEETMNL